MAQASYSFLDVAALDEVRERFAMGNALAILSADLEEVIWANGPGAGLFGHDDVEAIFGADAPLGAAAKRQIASLRDFPEIGRDRPLLVRVTLGMSSQALRFLASAVTLPDGEKAILLAQPVAEGMSEQALAKAIAGFSEPGHFVAFVGPAGAVDAATPAFERLGLTEEALADMSGAATDEDRIVKRVLPGRRGPLPAGLARLTDARSLIVVIDENWADEPEVDEAPETSRREVWYLGSDHFAEGESDAAAKAELVTLADATEVETSDQHATGAIAAVEESPEAPAANLSPAEGNSNEAAALTAATQHDSMEATDVATELGAKLGRKPEKPAHTLAAGLRAGPIRFAWRTDAEGRFSQISDEFARAVGEEAADIVGRHFRDVANAFGLDHSGDIASLLARRDTWSGRSVLWPIAGTDLHVPVDLAALPVYDRNRDFQGFRGFGVARMEDAGVDPQGTGLALQRVPPASGLPAPPPPAEAPAQGESKVPDADKALPAASLTHAQDKPHSDKVIHLAERRSQAPERTPASTSDKMLSLVERLAFQQIGERLRQASGQAEAETRAEPAQKKADDGGPTVAQDDGRRIADLKPLDGGSDKAEPTKAQPASSSQPDAAPETEAVTQAPTRTPKGTRPGLSLLDFAELGASAAKGVAQVEVEEAAASAERLNDASPGADATDDTTTDGENSKPVDEVAQTMPDETPSAESEVAALASPGEPSTTGDNGLSILEKLPVPVLVHSGDVLHYANHEFSVLTGYGSIEELAKAGGIGVLFADTFDDDAEAAGVEGLQGKHDRHMRLKKGDGTEIPIEAFLQSIPWEGRKALILVLSPVKDEIGGQSPLIAQLEARVAEMRTIIDTATDGVVLISRDGAIRSISRPAEALFGLDSDDVTGKPFTSLFAIESQRAARDYLAGLSNHGVASVLNDGREVIGREAEGRFIPLFMTIGKLPGDSGYCAVVRDITQWKRAEEDLTQARATAERASSHKSDFLARVSHEIRTPLNAIIGFSELMLDEKFGPVANDRYRDYLRDINRSGNHVLDLVNDLLDISKIEAGQQDMSYEAVPLNETLAETVALMQPQANRERVIIRSSFASKLPDVVADLRSVRQIALNILSNAVRYTQAGGQVIVSTAYEAHGEVVMRVRDTGIGMTPAEIEQALKPFKQINSLKRPRGDGTGLGLPLTKAMVEANRAKFTINSTPGEGTMVEVAFPSTRVLAD